MAQEMSEGQHIRILRDRPKGKTWDIEEDIILQRDIERAMKQSLRQGNGATAEANKTNGGRPGRRTKVRSYPHSV